MQIYNLKLNRYIIRTETKHDKTFLVVPVIMLTEGVHEGSAGAVFHSPDEFGKHVEAWNGIPITIDHPQIEGKFVSANTPELLEQGYVGRIFNTRLDGDRLKAEAWLDEALLRAESGQAFTTISQGNDMDVSVGIFSDDMPESGNWKGENFIAIVHNYRPDHLALLPQDKGACSFDDGCGIRANKEGGDGVSKGMSLEVWKGLRESGYSVIQVNAEQGFREITDNIRNKLQVSDTEFKLHFLEEVFDDHFIFSIVNSDNFSLSGEKLFKRDYTINKDGVIEFTGDPVEVVRNVEFVEIQANKEGGEEDMGQPAKKDVLETSKGEDCVAKLNTMIDAKAEEKAKKIVEPQVSKEDSRKEAIKVLQEDLIDSKKVLELVSGEAKAVLEYGVKAYGEKIDELVKRITANSEAYTVEELKDKSIEELEKMASLIKPVVDYTGQNLGGDLRTNKEGEQKASLLPIHLRQKKGGDKE